MPIVVFEALHETPVEVDAPAGGRLIDLCDDSRAPVPFSCRSASCGTCRVEIAEGATLLDPPGDEEAELLGVLGDDPARYRLACQARVRGVAGRVLVRTPTEW